jgi:hypothetical protein
MFETIVQFAVGGIFLVFLVWWKLADLVCLVCPPESKRIRIWLNSVVHTVVGLVALSCLVDPLIPGSVNMTIHAPPKFPTTQDNLQVRVVPVGFRGSVGGDRTVYSVFDTRGVAEVTVTMGMLETRMKIEVFDQTLPSQMVAMANVYVSPFVRRQIAAKVVVF